MRNVTIHVFYGIACTGKSTSAIQYATTYALRTIISTDYVRAVQRACTSPLENDPLMKVTHTAWQLFGTCSAENIIRGFKAHVDSVSPALVAVVHQLKRDGFDAIVEGVHCYSRTLDQFARIQQVRVYPQLHIVTRQETLLDFIQHKECERSCVGESKTWERHIPILMSIQNFLIDDALQRHVPILRKD